MQTTAHSEIGELKLTNAFELWAIIHSACCCGKTSRLHKFHDSLRLSWNLGIFGRIVSNLLCHAGLLNSTLLRPTFRQYHRYQRPERNSVVCRMYTHTVNCPNFPNPAVSMGSQECPEEITPIRMQLSAAALSALEDCPTMQQPFSKWSTLGVQEYTDLEEHSVSQWNKGQEIARNGSTLVSVVHRWTAFMDIVPIILCSRIVHLMLKSCPLWVSPTQRAQQASPSLAS